MPTTTPQRLHHASLVRPAEHIGYVRAMGRFFKDKNGSKLGKLFVLATIAYVVWPVDFIPDVIPIVGWLDDLGLATVAMGYLARVAARYREEARHPA
jgi:uncharacterized membrane protein YkvA (DUF1232 family)